MEQKPFRYRHDGWTPARQTAFLQALRDTRSVTDACHHVGLSTTSARRAYKRLPEFAAAWDHALALGQPALEKAAYQRAVEGWLEPIMHGGKIVAYRRRFSDSLLKLLMQRETARQAQAAEAPGYVTKRMTERELEDELVKKLGGLKKRLDAEERQRQLARAEDMERHEWEP